MRVAILMSTFYGQRYLSEQLDSLIAQTFTGWELFVRDDGSSDRTMEILKNYADNDRRIRIVSGKKNLGPAQSFLKLLQMVDAEYYFFCDQDDVWLSNKIELQLQHLQSRENTFGKKNPLAVVCDAMVVDEYLNTLANSFRKYNQYPVGLLEKNTAFFNVFNAAPGCTMLINKALKNIVDFNKGNILMHDWYLMLLAARNGNFFFIEDALILYRQHDNNTLGAEKGSLSAKLRKFFTHFHKAVSQLMAVYRFTNSVNKISFFKYIFLKVKFNFLRNQIDAK